MHFPRTGPSPRARSTPSRRARKPGASRLPSPHVVGRLWRRERWDEAWFDVAGLILAHGAESSFGGLPLLEVDLVTLDIASPDANDALIAAHASPEWLAWMCANFTDRSRVAELGGARSYASRLFDYAGSGRDQIAGVVETLRRDPRASYAAITTFEPLTDVSYIYTSPASVCWISGCGR